MFIFYLLGVGLPCRLIFCQFWLCQEAQCVYLHRHLGSPILLIFFKGPVFSFIGFLCCILFPMSLIFLLWLLSFFFCFLCVLFGLLFLKFKTEVIDLSSFFFYNIV